MKKSFYSVAAKQEVFPRKDPLFFLLGEVLSLGASFQGSLQTVYTGGLTFSIRRDCSFSG